MSHGDTGGACDECGKEPTRGLWRVVGGDVSGAYCLVCVDKLAEETQYARDVERVTAVPEDQS